MPSNTAPELMSTSTPLRASAIADTNVDGSQLASTFWLSFLAPVFLAATILIGLLASNFSYLAGALSIVALCFLVYEFPAQASARFVTTNFKRPLHFVPTLIAACAASGLAIGSALPSDWVARALPVGLIGELPHLAALYTALAIVTGGRYGMNYISMTQRLFVVLACWGASTMVGDFTLLAIGAVAVSINLVWRIQSRWVPHVASAVVRPTL